MTQVKDVEATVRHDYPFSLGTVLPPPFCDADPWKDLMLEVELHWFEPDARAIQAAGSTRETALDPRESSRSW